MKPDEENYVRALGELPQAKNERLALTRQCAQSWLDLLRELKQLDRYHLHESPDALKLGMEGQISAALQGIASLRRRTQGIRAVHDAREQALNRENSLKAIIRQRQGGR